MKGKLHPSALHSSSSHDVHEYRRAIERGEVLDPFEAQAQFRNSLSEEERKVYDAYTGRRDLEVFTSLRNPQEKDQTKSAQMEIPVEILAMRVYHTSSENLASKVARYQREHPQRESTQVSQR